MTKWANNKGTFLPASEVVDELPPGYYDCGMSFGRPYFQQIKLKTDNLYLFERTQTQEVITELKLFWSKEPLYKKYGVLYKRGVLLYGPQGTGKTSLINLVVNEAVEMGAICARIGDDTDTVAMALSFLRGVSPDRKIVVFMEDIDRHLRYSEETVLELLDGSDQLDNIIYVATTNYVENLPPRIANRPSRFDRKIKIDNPEAGIRKAYLQRLSKEVDNPQWDDWAEKTEGLSFAHLKELFISVIILGIPFDTALDTLQKMSFEDVSDEGGNNTTNGIPF